MQDPGEEGALRGMMQTHIVHYLQQPGQDSPRVATMRFGSTAKLLAKCKLKYYRISACNRPHQVTWDPAPGSAEVASGPLLSTPAESSDTSSQNPPKEAPCPAAATA